MWYLVAVEECIQKKVVEFSSLGSRLFHYRDVEYIQFRERAGLHDSFALENNLAKELFMRKVEAIGRIYPTPSKNVLQTRSKINVEFQSSSFI